MILSGVVGICSQSQLVGSPEQSRSRLLRVSNEMTRATSTHNARQNHVIIISVTSHPLGLKIISLYTQSKGLLVVS